jgi:DNA repair exonuclease SbcCD ATPase subunit
MVKFHKLSYRNFLSAGDNEIMVNLNPGASTLVVGSNGAGKSTMLDALSFALFGKPHRSINKPQLVNSINGKNCSVSVEFSINSINYKIVRGIKPNIFEIWQNGILLNQESHSRDYQKLLETNILKLNHKSFHQVVVLGSSNFIPFMQLSANNRREVIEDLLDINIFTKMNVALKERNSKLRDTIKDTENQIVVIKEKIILQCAHIDSLKQIDENNAAKYNDEITSLSENIARLLETNARNRERYDTHFSSANAAVIKAEHTRTSLLSYEKQIKDNIAKVVAEAKFYEDHDDCPTCQRVLDGDIKDHKLQGCKEKAAELQDGYEMLKIKMLETQNAYNLASDAYDDIGNLQKEISTNNVMIAQLESRITDLNKYLQQSFAESDTTFANNFLETLREEKEALSDLRSTQIEDRTYNEAIAELLKDTGIKTKIIRQYLPVMNKLINHYLQIFDFFISFNLDESFNEQIKSRHRDDFSYSSFSEGEKQKINMALLFSWRAVAKMKNSANTNLMILDETFDASLDADGIDNLLKILQTLDSDTNVFVISHKQDLLESKFERKMEFEKVKNFSRMIEHS